MMNMMNLDWMIPNSLREGDPNTLEKALLVTKYAATIFQLSLGFPAIMYYFGAYDGALINLIFLVLIAMSPLVMRITGSPQIASNTLIGLLVVLLIALCALLGGIVAPPAPFFVAASIAAVSLIGIRGAIVWSIICAMALAGMGLVELTGVDFPNELSPGETLFVRIMAFPVLIAISLAMIVQFHSAAHDALLAVKHANRRIAKMIQHVEATNQALSRSAAEFLGKNTTILPKQSTVGLTQRMMSTAQSGRAMLEEVGESLHGMIRQYKEISERVRELHIQSRTISRLVKAIDSISDRLDLMALNTGIEASHAGESGRRFELLAADMRRLAERVSGETMGIKAVIRNVQIQTDSALEASNLGHGLTDISTNKLDSMSQAFDDMYQLIERAAEASMHMTEDTQNQIAAIRRLAQVGRQL